MSEKHDALVVFSPSGKRGRFPLGTPVLQAARELGVDIDSICGGRARCARCQVEPVDGSFPKENIVSRLVNLSEAGAAEEDCRLRGRLKPGMRLGCQARVEGDIRIDVPASSQVHHQVVRKEHEVRDIELDPVMHLYFVDVPEPDINVPEGDLQRLLQALQNDWELQLNEWDPSVLSGLQHSLREGKWQVTVAVRDGRRIVAVWPGFRDRVYGAAIDVGSTTIAVNLCDLGSGEVLASAGAMNPQIRFGEDLMSRVSYAMLNEDGAARMTEAVRQELDRLLRQTAEQADISTEEILELTLVGNPVMHHLVLGMDPVPLGTAPFALGTDQPVDISAGALDLSLHPATRAWFLPCIAGHVGADTAGVLLAEAPWEREEINLIIDVGTNAEIVLGNHNRLLAASSPTGPAFEGAQISSGQRAAPGAIERVRIDPATLEPRIRVVGSDVWSDEAEFEQSIGAQGVTGICGSGIIEAVAGMYLAGILRTDGVIDGDARDRSDRIQADGRTFSYRLFDGKPAVVITQGDVRAIQLAKAALYAGARLLMDRFGIEQVDCIRLAGAFGSHIDVKYAMVLGLIPDCDLQKVSSARNAAGTGARIALLNRESRREICRRVAAIEKIETAVDPDFQRHFVEAMGIPHSTSTFTELACSVNLPQAGRMSRKRKSMRKRSG